MHLTAANLVHYLIARGCITAESVVDGDFRVATTDRRNRCFRVMRGRHTGLFLKQIRIVEDDRISSLYREAQCYRLAGLDADTQPLLQSMPRFVDYDAQRHVLIVELLDDSQALNECYERVGRIPDDIGVLLARAMGNYHSNAGRKFCEQQDGALFRNQVPWVLSIHEDETGPLSNANSQLLAAIRQDGELQALLDELRHGWQHETLINGDVKLDNCIVFGPDDDHLVVRIVDWEYLDRGDSCWDVGGLLQSFLTHWVKSLVVPQQISVEEVVESLAEQLKPLRPTFRAFWDEYTDVREFDAESSQRCLDKSIRCGAARLIQTAFEFMHLSDKIEENFALIPRISRWMLQNPKAAGSRLFGFSHEEPA